MRVFVRLLILVMRCKAWPTLPSEPRDRRGLQLDRMKENDPTWCGVPCRVRKTTCAAIREEDRNTSQAASLGPGGGVLCPITQQSTYQGDAVVAGERGDNAPATMARGGTSSALHQRSGCPHRHHRGPLIFPTCFVRWFFSRWPGSIQTSKAL